jgi:hypothetical protein
MRDIFFLLLAVGILTLQAYFLYYYLVGTPTTARVDHCDVVPARESSAACTGTWSVGGQSQTGKIEPVFEEPFWTRNVGPKVGSSLQVRVHDGTAVRRSTDLYLYSALGAFPLAACLPRLWRAWRGRNRG